MKPSMSFLVVYPAKTTPPLLNSRCLKFPRLFLFALRHRPHRDRVFIHPVLGLRDRFLNSASKSIESKILNSQEKKGRRKKSVNEKFRGNLCNFFHKFFWFRGISIRNFFVRRRILWKFYNSTYLRVEKGKFLEPMRVIFIYNSF